ncbi:toxin-antitoxin system YwqK family antitoxin [Pontibacter qinzhouensis]|uniref:Toxin-antitoxin system YwqK family antitoxin n=1 Tax=Pontibacter qinzhouensis TaxID=2603253 RepID=A0A5C8IEP9_9BACT|nr:toxin-antitoxin system YwqK family antitoxin [Pontibacter qinzhouensis]TXK18383.1 toxin-antitoxin system YwqK family antitoxin [Pontibacter qinzhouensis]
MNLALVLRILPFLLLMVACNSNREFEEKYDRETGLTERIEYYPNGKIKARGFFKDGIQHGKAIQYDESGKLEAKSTYLNGVLDGMLKIYYPNGKLKEETIYSKGVPVGWSYEYRENGKMQAAYQYYRFEDRYKGNQRIRYSEAGEIIADSSHYITVFSDRDTISLGEEIKLHFKLEAPFYGSKSQVRLEVGGFDDQYKLVNPKMTDTIAGDGLSAEYTVRPLRKGIHVVRGRLEDYKVEPISAEEAMKRYNIKAENPDEIGSRTESVYINFTEKFFVK